MDNWLDELEVEAFKKSLEKDWKTYFKEMIEKMEEKQKDGTYFIESPMAFQCKKCGEWLPPYTGGEFKKCSCGWLGVDGTSRYIRISPTIEEINQAEPEEVMKNW